MWVWLWLVPLPYIIQFIFRYLDPQNRYYETVFVGEFGIIETGTNLFLFLAIIFALICARRAHGWGLSGMTALLLIYAGGCFFFLGEEVSWGQHIFQWDSPEFFLENNRRNETNLHNMEFINKSIPKWIVVIAMTVGGALLPFIFKQRKRSYQPHVHWIFWLLPTRICIPAGIIVFLSNLAAKIPAINDIARHIGVRESTELYISIFFLIYAYSLYIRMKQFNSADNPEALIGP